MPDVIGLRMNWSVFHFFTTCGHCDFVCSMHFYSTHWFVIQCFKPHERPKKQSCHLMLIITDHSFLFSLDIDRYWLNCSFLFHPDNAKYHAERENQKIENEQTSQRERERERLSAPLLRLCLYSGWCARACLHFYTWEDACVHNRQTASTAKSWSVSECSFVLSSCVFYAPCWHAHDNVFSVNYCLRIQ